MNYESLKLYKELVKWRDEELNMGNMIKVRCIQTVITRVRKRNRFVY